MYKEKLKHYLDDLAAKKPAPGGGSAAALIGATALGLASMVANFTLGKERFKAAEEEIRAALKRSEASRKRLQRLIDEDVAAYKQLSSVFKTLTDDQYGKSRLRKAVKAALHVPLEICRICAGSSGLTKTLLEKGNPNLITDAAIAAEGLRCAFIAAKLNVYINLNCLDDKTYAEHIKKELVALEKSVQRSAEDVVKRTFQKLS